MEPVTHLTLLGDLNSLPILSSWQLPRREPKSHIPTSGKASRSRVLKQEQLRLQVAQSRSRLPALATPVVVSQLGDSPKHDFAQHHELVDVIADLVALDKTLPADALIRARFKLRV